MKGFSIQTEIEEYTAFEEYVKEAKLGSHDLVLCGRHTYEDYLAPLDLEVQTLLREEYGKGEPTDDMVNAMLEALRDKKYGRIIAIGGGSVIDIAKAIAVAKATDTVDDLYDNVEQLEAYHELIVIPTTCGTGSEVTNISVMNRVSKGVKMGLSSPAMLPKKAVLITNMLTSLPYQTFATSSIDAMVHSVESYLSPNACTLSRMFSKEAFCMIIKCWKKTVETGGEDAWKKYAADFLKASNMAGIGFGYAGCAAVHATAYPLGSVYHIPHGQSNQLMFRAVMEKYKELMPVGRLSEVEEMIAEVLELTEDEKRTNQVWEAFYHLMDQILKAEPLRTFGVKESDLPEFAGNVVRTQMRLLKNNYVPLSEEQIFDIYRKAF